MNQAPYLLSKVFIFYFNSDSGMLLFASSSNSYRWYPIRPIDVSPWKYVTFLKLRAEVIDGLTLKIVRDRKTAAEMAMSYPTASFQMMLLDCYSLT